LGRFFIRGCQVEACNLFFNSLGRILTSPTAEIYFRIFGRSFSRRFNIDKVGLRG
jgi:hypothetical protein